MAMTKSKSVKVRRGGLSRQLGVPEEKNIPLKLVEKVSDTKVGKTIRNPTKTGKRTLKVTKKMKKRAIIVEAAKKIRRLG